MELNQLKQNVENVMETVKRESLPWGRAPKVIAVTKYVSGEEVLPLANCGITDIGENRVQVVQEKLPVIGGKFSLHLIGRLQTNKVKYIIKDVCMIHSVDRLPLALEIDRQAQMHNTRMDVLLQVNIANEEQKGGVPVEEVRPLLKSCAALPGLHVKGLMTMMPLGAEESFILEKFTEMRRLLDRLHEENINHTDMTELSMGMSQDYALAARCGATMVRVGSAIWK